MRRIDTPDELFAPGSPATSTKGTAVRNWWLNAIQEELAGVVEGFGGTLDALNDGQVFELLIANLANIIGNASNVFRVATAVGANDATPLAQVQALLTAYLPKRTFTASDYIRIPDVAGGWIMQWLITGTIAAGGSAVLTLPTTFPNAILSSGANPASATASQTPISGSVAHTSTSQITVYNRSSVAEQFRVTVLGN